LIRAERTGNSQCCGFLVSNSRLTRTPHLALFWPAGQGAVRFGKDVIEGNITAEKVAGKLVLVGTSRWPVGREDHARPSGHAGVEVHAQLLEAALTNSLLAAPSYSISLK